MKEEVKVWIKENTSINDIENIYPEFRVPEEVIQHIKNHITSTNTSNNFPPLSMPISKVSSVVQKRSESYESKADQRFGFDILN